MFEETFLGESCEQVTAEMLLTSLEHVGIVSRILVESVHDPFTCSPPSLSLEYSLVKPMDNYVITNLHDDLGLMDTEIE